MVPEVSAAVYGWFYHKPRKVLWGRAVHTLADRWGGGSASLLGPADMP